MRDVQTVGHFPIQYSNLLYSVTLIKGCHSVTDSIKKHSLSQLQHILSSINAQMHLLHKLMQWNLPANLLHSMRRTPSDSWTGTD